MDKPEESTEIDINEPVALTFALRYLNSFAKACAWLGGIGSALPISGATCPSCCRLRRASNERMPDTLCLPLPRPRPRTRRPRRCRRTWC